MKEHVITSFNSSKAESQSELLYDWRFTGHQFMAPSRVILTTTDYFFNETLVIIVLI
jgi:hypothetical protein